MHHLGSCRLSRYWMTVVCLTSGSGKSVTTPAGWNQRRAEWSDRAQRAKWAQTYDYLSKYHVNPHAVLCCFVIVACSACGPDSMIMVLSHINKLNESTELCNHFFRSPLGLKMSPCLRVNIKSLVCDPTLWFKSVLRELVNPDLCQIVNNQIKLTMRLPTHTKMWAACLS